MSKYDRLKVHLRGLTGNEWRASFTDIERVLGFELPSSARSYQAWWANQTAKPAVQTYAWMDAGWRTEELDLARDRVIFRRVVKASAPRIAPKPTPIAPKARAAPPMNCDLSLQFAWTPLGEITLGADRKLVFPKAPPSPGLYRFRVVLGLHEGRYVGETDGLARRMGFYRTPGQSQTTNIRVNHILANALAEGANVTLETVTEATIAGAAADLGRTEVRRLLENAALVLGGGEDITSFNR
jgi:hypothetical protein